MQSSFFSVSFSQIYDTLSVDLLYELSDLASRSVDLKFLFSSMFLKILGLMILPKNQMKNEIPSFDGNISKNFVFSWIIYKNYNRCPFWFQIYSLSVDLIHLISDYSIRFIDFHKITRKTEFTWFLLYKILSEEFMHVSISVS